jgi:hypothetical protein
MQQGKIQRRWGTKGHTYNRNKQNNGKGFVIRTATLIEKTMDTTHTFIFGNVFGGAVRPCCEPFRLSD